MTTITTPAQVTSIDQPASGGFSLRDRFSTFLVSLPSELKLQGDFPFKEDVIKTYLIWNLSLASIPCSVANNSPAYVVILDLPPNPLPALSRYSLTLKLTNEGLAYAPYSLTIT